MAFHSSGIGMGISFQQEWNEPISFLLEWNELISFPSEWNGVISFHPKWKQRVWGIEASNRSLKQAYSGSNDHTDTDTNISEPGIGIGMNTRYRSKPTPNLCLHMGEGGIGVVAHRPCCTPQPHNPKAYEQHQGSNGVFLNIKRHQNSPDSIFFKWWNCPDGEPPPVKILTLLNVKDLDCKESAQAELFLEHCM